MLDRMAIRLRSRKLGDHRGFRSTEFPYCRRSVSKDQKRRRAWAGLLIDYSWHYTKRKAICLMACDVIQVVGVRGSLAPLFFHFLSRIPRLIFLALKPYEFLISRISLLERGFSMASSSRYQPTKQP